MALYQTWKDLVGEERDSALSATTSTNNQETGSEKFAFTSERLCELGASSELTGLFEEKERLEKQLRLFDGASEPESDDERHKLCFPVKVHTKESRIEERRERLHDEQMAMLKKKQQAKNKLERKHAEQRLQTAREANDKEMIRRRAELVDQELRKRILQGAIVDKRNNLRREEVRAKARSDRQMVLTQLRSKHEREEEQKRRSREHILVMKRWQMQRQRALVAQSVVRKQTVLLDQLRHEQIVASAVSRMVQKRQELVYQEKKEYEHRKQSRIAAGKILIQQRKDAREFDRMREQSRDRARDELRRKCAANVIVKRQLDKRSFRER